MIRVSFLLGIIYFKFIINILWCLELDIIHFNDVYNIDERQIDEKNSSDRDIVAGAARFARALHMYNSPEKLVIFSGDLFFPSICKYIIIYSMIWKFTIILQYFSEHKVRRLINGVSIWVIRRQHLMSWKSWARHGNWSRQDFDRANKLSMDHEQSFWER